MSKIKFIAVFGPVVFLFYAIAAISSYTNIKDAFSSINSFSNFFSALSEDTRCVRKTATPSQSCLMPLTSWEYDSTTNNCVKVPTSGCSPDAPYIVFQTESECKLSCVSE